MACMSGWHGINGRACPDTQTVSLKLQEEGGPAPDTQKQPIDWSITGLAFLFPALGGLLFGYDIGATSGALVSIKSSEFSGTDW